MLEYKSNRAGPEIEILRTDEDGNEEPVRRLRARDQGRVQAVSTVLEIVNQNPPLNTVEITEERESAICEIMAEKSLSFRDVIELAFEKGLDELEDGSKYSYVLKREQRGPRFHTVRSEFDSLGEVMKEVSEDAEEVEPGHSDYRTFKDEHFIYHVKRHRK